MLKDRVANLVDNGYESTLLPIIEHLELKAQLPEALQIKFDAMGNTPVSEPSVYEAINSGELETLALAVLSEDEIKSFTAEEIGNFLFLVEKRITEYRNEDGTFKSTPNTEDCRLPNFLESAQIRKMFLKQNDLINKFAETAESKARDKVTKEIQSCTKDMDSLFMKISGLDEDSLTDWEKALVITMIAGTANNAFLSAQGKRSLS